MLGTLNNCANGFTPWDTYLTCEENFHAYFVNRGEISTEQRRYGVSAKGFGYRWHEHDERFDAQVHPNELNRFGWVVEIDPFDPQSTPVKRTALGRFSHEGAVHTLARDRRVVIYSGDDNRNEYIYKFVSRDAFDAANPARNRDLLDNGTLYVARFNADGTGTWLELTHGRNGLTPANGFASQAEVLIHTRQAGDRAGATMMDRPEWITVHPQTGEVYCSLTNNKSRGGTTVNAPDGTTPSGSCEPAGGWTANPRAENIFGHILRWREGGGDAASTTLRMGRVHPVRRPVQSRSQQARQHPRRSVRQPRRTVDRRRRSALDRDRHLAAPRCTRASTRASATTRCCAPIPSRARCAASSRARAAAR